MALDIQKKTLNNKTWTAITIPVGHYSIIRQSNSVIWITEDNNVDTSNLAENDNVQSIENTYTFMLSQSKTVYLLSEEPEAYIVVSKDISI